MFLLSSHLVFWAGWGKRFKRTWNIIDTKPAYPAMVPQSNEIIGERTTSSPQKRSASPTAIQQDSSSSTGRQTNPCGMSVIRESLQSKGIPPHTVNIIMSSWRESSQRQYGTYLQKWQNFCSPQSVDSISTSMSHVLEFFTEFYDNNCGYSCLLYTSPSPRDA